MNKEMERKDVEKRSLKEEVRIGRREEEEETEGEDRESKRGVNGKREVVDS